MSRRQNHLRLSTLKLLNESGDVTLAWDEISKDAVVDVIRKKIKEGYSFFRLVAKQHIRITATENFDTMNSVIISDKDFREIAAKLNLARVKVISDNDAKYERVKSAEEVVEPGTHTVGIKPARGG